MRRAVVPLMSAGNCGVVEFVADRFPCFAAVIGALNQLAEPPGGLRRVDPVGVYGRAFEVIHFPAGKVRAADVPLLALAVRRQDERALARADENSHSAHQQLLPLRWPHSRCSDICSKCSSLLLTEAGRTGKQGESFNYFAIPSHFRSFRWVSASAVISLRVKRENQLIARTTIKRRGPCAPMTRIFSMSAVRLDPVMRQRKEFWATVPRS